MGAGQRSKVVIERGLVGGVERRENEGRERGNPRKGKAGTPFRSEGRGEGNIKHDQGKETVNSPLNCGQVGVPLLGHVSLSSTVIYNRSNLTRRPLSCSNTSSFSRPSSVLRST